MGGEDVIFSSKDLDLPAITSARRPLLPHPAPSAPSPPPPAPIVSISTMGDRGEPLVRANGEEQDAEEGLPRYHLVSNTSSPLETSVV